MTVVAGPNGSGKSTITKSLFVGVDSVDRNLARVKERVGKGGNFVPDSDARRRYQRYEPSQDPPNRSCRIVWVTGQIPEWAKPAILSSTP